LRRLPKDWISCGKNIDPKISLLCFSYAGAGSSVFYGWDETIPPHIEIDVVVLPGRDSRFSELPYRDMPELVSDLTRDLGPVLRFPFALFGHSMGALIAFEFARKLRALGFRQPSHLFLSGMTSPDTYTPSESIHNLPYESLIERLKQMSGIPNHILHNDEFMRVFEPAIRADFEMCYRYEFRQEEPLDCSLSVFGGMDDLITENDLLLWQKHTKRQLKLRMYNGDHFFINTCRDVVLNDIVNDITQVLA
jgi:medium-chain acyl-[acyl-carrier-protein] hydrolase